jgi:CubicO group peptidase (beta-lactamase class C family)
VTAIEAIGGWSAPNKAAAVVQPSTKAETVGHVDAPFALASVTKLLTALAVLVATEEEVIALDDPAGPRGSTVRHLLAHASGLGPDAAHGVITPPATRRIYSNAGFEVLADHLATASAMPFETYLAEAVLEPLGMASTRLVGSPAYGAVSTVADLARFAAELLTPTLICADTLAEAVTVAFPALTGVLPGFGRQSPNPWGLGLEIRGRKSPHWTGSANSAATFGHFGRSGTFLWVDPEAAVACVVLTDHSFGSWAAQAWPELSDAVLRDVGAVKTDEKSE